MPVVPPGAKAEAAERGRLTGAGIVERMGREQMRAADADRQHVVDRLHAALTEGRLDLHEYDERVQQAYRSKTYGDLEGLLGDLPGADQVVAVSTPAATPVPAATAGNPTAEWLARVWSFWVFLAGITTVIWGITSIAAGELEYFWPMWVAGPWGVILLVSSIGGLASGAPRKMVAERERNELAKEHRRARRALQARAIAAGELPQKPTKEQRRQFVVDAVERGELPPKPRKP